MSPVYTPSPRSGREQERGNCNSSGWGAEVPGSAGAGGSAQVFGLGSVLLILAYASEAVVPRRIQDIAQGWPARRSDASRPGSSPFGSARFVHGLLSITQHSMSSVCFESYL